MNHRSGELLDEPQVAGIVSEKVAEAVEPVTATPSQRARAAAHRSLFRQVAGPQGTFAPANEPAQLAAVVCEQTPAVQQAPTGCGQGFGLQTVP